VFVFHFCHLSWKVGFHISAHGNLCFSSQCTVNSHAIQVVSVKFFIHTDKGGEGGWELVEGETDLYT
jgi:hypothetical protein